MDISSILNRSYKATLSSATPVTVRASHLPDGATVFASPGAGSTVSVETSVDDSTWQAWPGGAVTVATSYSLEGKIQSIRFTRTAGTANCTVGAIW